MMAIGAVIGQFFSRIQKHRPDYRIDLGFGKAVARGLEWTILSW
jgi:hypothetical protein